MRQTTRSAAVIFDGLIFQFKLTRDVLTFLSCCNELILVVVSSEIEFVHWQSKSIIECEIDFKVPHVAMSNDVT